MTRRFSAMKINALRSIACCLMAALVITSTVAPAFAADRSYPNRPLRIIVSTTPGGGPDIMARLIGQRLAETLGQQAVIDNRAGASGAPASSEQGSRLRDVN